jgi:hypothetical protein
VRNVLTVTVVIGLLTMPATSQAARTRLDVRVYDTEMMPAADQSVALRAAAGVLAAAGIDVGWVICGESGAPGNPDVCQTPLGPADLSLRLARLPAAPSARGQLELGYSLVDTSARDGKLATVYVDRVDWLAKQAGAAAPVVLGFAAAHEIGHLLLGTNAHASHGIMRAVWSRSELEHENAGDWRFSRAEGSRMRASVAERNGLRLSQNAAGCSAARDDTAGASAECGRTALAALRAVAADADR